MGFYVADVNNPGLDMSLLIDGLTFPGVQVDGRSFVINDYKMDAVFESKFPGPDVGNATPMYSIEAYSDSMDSYSGTRSTDIDINGGQFVDSYHSHAPEELIPGQMFDTLDYKVFSRPGWDYMNDGHGFEMKSTMQLGLAVTEINFADLVEYPISITVVNIGTGETLYKNVNYSVDWPNRTVNVHSGYEILDMLKVYVASIGGGNQLLRQEVLGAEIIDTYDVPINHTEIGEVIMFSNGERIFNIEVEEIDQYSSRLVISDTFEEDAYVTITVLGHGDHSATYYNDDIFINGYPEEARLDQSYFGEARFAPAYTPSEEQLVLENPVEGISSEMNAVVEVNGKRLQSPTGIRHYGNDIQRVFNLPLVPDSTVFDENDVIVLINNELQIYSDQYIINESTVDDVIYGNYFIVLHDAPAKGDVIEIFVTADAEYNFNNGQIEFMNGVTVDVSSPIEEENDIIAIKTYNGTEELHLLTEVFVGPNIISEDIIDLFGDEFDYDLFDELSGLDVQVNIFPLRRAMSISLQEPYEYELISIPKINGNRLWVTVNGSRLNHITDYVIINDTHLEILGDVVADTDVIVVTSMTDNVATDGVNFRLFKDMRGNVAMYSMNDSLQTYLVADLADTDDIIFLNDVTNLGVPNLEAAVFGILMINGERITYRDIDYNNNTVSGLRRGTAGTGANYQPIDSLVHDVGKDALVQWDYNKIWYAQGDIHRDGIIDNYDNGIGFDDSTLAVNPGDPDGPALVGIVDPINGFDATPFSPGPEVASNGYPLQDQTTPPAEFIKI